MRSRIILLVKIAILVAVLYWLASSFSEDDWRALRDQPKRWELLSLAAAIVLAAHVVSYLRWMMLICSMQIPFSPIEAIRLGFLGNLFNTVSAGSVGGDVFKAIAVARHVPTRRPEVVASVLVDRALGLLGLVTVAAIGLCVYGDENLTETLRLIRNGAILVALVGLVGITSVVIAGSRLPFSWLLKIPWIGESLLRMAESGLVFDHRPWLAFKLIAASVAVHCLLTFSTFCISHGLYTTAPTLSEHFSVVPPAMAAGALPLTPGGVGLQEAAIATLFDEVLKKPTSEHVEDQANSRDLPSSQAAVMSPPVDSLQPADATGFSGVVVAAMYRLMLLGVAGVGAVFYFVGFGRVRADEVAGAFAAAKGSNAAGDRTESKGPDTQS